MMHSYAGDTILLDSGVTRVLILVVMDDALVHSLTNLELNSYDSLNPCCNG